MEIRIHVDLIVVVGIGECRGVESGVNCRYVLRQTVSIDIRRCDIDFVVVDRIGSSRIFYSGITVMGMDAFQKYVDAGSDDIIGFVTGRFGNDRVQFRVIVIKSEKRGGSGPDFVRIGFHGKLDDRFCIGFVYIGITIELNGQIVNVVGKFVYTIGVIVYGLDQ